MRARQRVVQWLYKAGGTRGRNPAGRQAHSSPTLTPLPARRRRRRCRGFLCSNPSSSLAPSALSACSAALTALAARPRALDLAPPQAACHTWLPPSWHLDLGATWVAAGWRLGAAHRPEAHSRQPAGARALSAASSSARRPGAGSSRSAAPSRPTRCSAGPPAHSGGRRLHEGGG